MLDAAPADADVLLRGLTVTPPAAAAPELHFGGPDQPPRTLRDMLKARIEAARPGDEILWATYYFRDRELADALVAARARGVRVRVVVDANPRRADANAAVIARLRAGLGDDLRLHRPAFPGARLHAKIYAFQGSSPAVFVGSFNPSGDTPEDPRVIAEIGDQDRGHNLLVQFRNRTLVQALAAQAGRIWRAANLSRFSRRQNRIVRADTTAVFFFPRLSGGVVEGSLRRLRRGDRVQAAISHLEPGPFTHNLAAAARRGADVQLVVHDTRRRVPPAAVRALSEAGVAIRRYCHPDKLPMHAKFVVVSRGEAQEAWFGSLNHNLNSRWLNQEVLVRSTEPTLTAGLSQRFTAIAAEAERYGDC